MLITNISILTFPRVLIAIYSLIFLVTIHVHQRDVTSELASLARSKRISDANDFEWLKQARFYWKNGISDDISPDGISHMMCYMLHILCLGCTGTTSSVISISKHLLRASYLLSKCQVPLICHSILPFYISCFE